MWNPTRGESKRFETGAWSCREGAIVLEFFSGTPVRAGQPFAYDERRLVLHKSAGTGRCHTHSPQT